MAQRILFLSSMPVSPATGGGITAFNFLETSTQNDLVFYASPRTYTPSEAPFPEILSRRCLFSNKRVIPLVPGGRKIKFIRRINDFTIRPNNFILSRFVVIHQLLSFIREHSIESLVICPQCLFDLQISHALICKTNLPAVAWFMDDYFRTPFAYSLLRELQQDVKQCFVISEAMQQYFWGNFRQESVVLNNSVYFDDPPELLPTVEPVFRIAYMGAVNAYYQEVLIQFVNALEGLKGTVELHIYSHSVLPAAFTEMKHSTWKLFAPVPPNQVASVLTSYDALLMLSSFRNEHRGVAETSLASKWADYLAACRPIIVFGPHYAQNVIYAKKHGMAEVIDSPAPAALQAMLGTLRDDLQKRRELASRAYRFGQAHHNLAKNQALLWKSLHQLTNPQ